MSDELVELIAHHKEDASTLDLRANLSTMRSYGYTPMSDLDRLTDKGKWRYFRAPDETVIAYHQPTEFDLYQSYVFGTKPDIEPDIDEILENSDILFEQIIKPDSTSSRHPMMNSGKSVAGMLIGGVAGLATGMTLGYQMDNGGFAFFGGALLGVIGGYFGAAVGAGATAADHESYEANLPRVVDQLHNPENYRWVRESVIRLARSIDQPYVALEKKMRLTD